MSRSILQREAGTNPQDDYRIGFQGFLAKYPESKGYSFRFEAHSGDGDVRVVIQVIYPDGRSTPLCNIALESVPVIKQYLHETGALKILYEGIRTETLAGLEQVRVALGVKPELSKAEQVLGELIEILYMEDEELNPDKEWDSDTLEEIGKLMIDNGLVPPEPE